MSSATYLERTFAHCSLVYVYTGTQNVKTHNRTTQKTKKMSNTEPTKKPDVNAGAHEGYTLMVGMIN
jgi:hypothetical protein